VLEQTAETHRRRLEEMEAQSARKHTALLDRFTGTAAALERLMEVTTAQAHEMARLHEESGQLVRLQEGLRQNLAALAGAGAFEEAVHSLAAAIHLLTARAGALRLHEQTHRPGAAA
jgi:hypothetical protein